jgi:DNA-binding beta-propeller fold protein YncE
MLFAWISFGQSTLTFMAAVKDGANGVRGLYRPTSVAVSPDNKNAYVSGEVSLVMFTRNPATGELSYTGSFINGKNGVVGLDGGRSVVVSPDNKSVYACAMNDRTIVGYKRDATTGALTFQFCLKGDSAGLPTSIAVSPDGNYLYAGGFNDSAVSVFRRDTATGELTRTADYRQDRGSACGMGSILRVAVSPDDNSVYALDYMVPSMTMFRPDAAGGLTAGGCFYPDSLRFRSAGPGFQIVVSPDNKNIYVTRAEFIAVFKRDVSTGALRYFTNVPGSSLGLDPVSIAIGPDGRTGYVVDGRYVRVFGRDTSTGALKQIDTIEARQDSVEGLVGCRWVTVSPDNRNVYVASNDENAVAVFGIVSPPAAASARPLPSRRNRVVSATQVGGFFTIAFSAGASGGLAVSLFNVRGGLVKKMVKKKIESGGGSYKADFSSVPHGVYLLRCSIDRECEMTKTVVTKKH